MYLGLIKESKRLQPYVMCMRVLLVVSLIFLGVAPGGLVLAEGEVARAEEPALVSVLSPWIMTDKSEYFPGETVFITGGGFLALEFVRILIANPDGAAVQDNAVRAAADGSVEDIYLIPVEGRPSPQYYIEATGQTSGAVARTSFADPNPPTISGYTFSDLNGDGLWNLGEPGLDGWTITATATGQTTKTATTGAGAWPDGFYQFTFSASETGAWTISETLPAGWTQTRPTGSGTYTIGVASGGGLPSTGNDFGNFQTASVSGYKFSDLNRDGLWDGSEPALSDWTVNATNGPATKTDLTDVSGFYEFTFSASETGTWTISETLQAGWTQTTSPATHSIAVQSGVNSQNNNFGNAAVFTPAGQPGGPLPGAQGGAELRGAQVPDGGVRPFSDGVLPPAGFEVASAGRVSEAQAPEAGALPFPPIWLVIELLGLALIAAGALLLIRKWVA